jgi:GT2 family glycosyltransferase
MMPSQWNHQMQVESKQSDKVLCVVWCTGTQDYFDVAGACVRRLICLTDFDVALVSTDPDRVPVTSDARLSRFSHHLDRTHRRADPFIGKFGAVQQALKTHSHEIVALMDADCLVQRWVSSDDVRLALGNHQLAMAEQKFTRGTDMSREKFLDHYLSVSLPGVASNAYHPSLSEFRYYNSGVVLGRREAWTELIEFAAPIARARPLEIRGQMVADQDIIQVWVNSIRPGIARELDPEEWNACDLWCDVDTTRVRIRHYSNFCQGPSPELISLIAPTPGCEALIVTHESAQSIGQAVDSCLHSGVESVLVIDNKSSDASADVANAHGANVLLLDQNLGFGAAANIGLAGSQLQDVCVLNPDVVMTPEAMHGMRQALAHEPSALVAPRQSTPDRGILGFQPQVTRLRLSAALIENNRPNAFPIFDRLVNRPGVRSGSAWLLGSCLMARNEAWQSLHGFDISYFLYMEDVDLCDRWRASNRPLRLAPQIIQHSMGSGSAISIQQRIEFLNQARLTYARSKYGRVFHALLKTACT